MLECKYDPAFTTGGGGGGGEVRRGGGGKNVQKKFRRVAQKNLVIVRDFREGSASLLKLCEEIGGILRNLECYASKKRAFLSMKTTGVSGCNAKNKRPRREERPGQRKNV